MLDSALAAATDPDQLRGALEALLLNQLPHGVAKDVATLLVDTACYETPEALAAITKADLQSLRVPLGRQPRVLQTIFGQVLNPVEQPAPAPALALTTTPVPGSSLDPRYRNLKTAWPAPESTALPAPESMLDFGMGIRGYLRQLPSVPSAAGVIIDSSVWADRVFTLFTNPWDDIHADHEPAGPHDKALCASLLAAPGAVPPWAAALVRQQIRQDHGLGALLVLCRQVFTNTDISDAALKKAVRAPTKGSNPGQIAKRLAQWDSDLGACVSRGFVIDDHDKRTGLHRRIAGLDLFVPAVAALEATAPYTAVALRKVLGNVADKAKSGISYSQTSQSGNSTLSAHAALPKGAKAAKKAAAKLAASAAAPEAGARKGVCYAFRDR